jgi:tRNA(Ile)-lysidine synthase
MGNPAPAGLRSGKMASPPTKTPVSTKRKRLADWPVVAEALSKQIPLAALHSVAMAAAGADRLRPKRRGARRPARWALAFSGGADSLALLLVLWAEAPGRWDRDFVVLHFNHRLRGRASLADENFCARVCASLGVKFVAGRWSGRHPQASEAEARTARFAFFVREMTRRKINHLWLGHQQDDIAETMLMRLARGSGAGGLAAPRPVQSMGDGRLHLRPLLTLKKSVIVAALRQAGADWCEDETNAAGAYFRNRVRRSVLQAWTKAAARDALAGAALSREMLEEDDTALECWVDGLGVLHRGRLDVRALQGLPRAVIRRALHRWLLTVRPQTDLSRQGFQILLAAVERGKATRFSLGRTDFAVIHEGQLKLVRT